MPVAPTRSVPPPCTRSEREAQQHEHAEHEELGIHDSEWYWNTTSWEPAGTGTPTKLGAIIAVFTGLPSTVARQCGAYDSFSITHAGRVAVTVPANSPLASETRARDDASRRTSRTAP